VCPLFQCIHWISTFSADKGVTFTLIKLTPYVVKVILIYDEVFSHFHVTFGVYDTNAGCQVACATKFCTAVPNVSGFSVCNLLFNGICNFVPVSNFGN
jgi:hypothetical protein